MTEETKTEAAATPTEAVPGTEAKDGATVLTKDQGTDDAGKAKDDPSRAAAEGAPEEYADFTLPEGETPNVEILTEAKAVFKELGLSQDQAQKLVDFQTSKELAAMEKEAAAYTERVNSWWTQTQADPELGGDKWDANLAVIKSGYELVKSPELESLLGEPSEKNPEGLGLQRHPAINRMLFRIGKALAEDTLAKPASGASPTKAAGDVIFAKSLGKE